MSPSLAFALVLFLSFPGELFWPWWQPPNPFSGTPKRFHVTEKGEFVVKSVSFLQRFHFPLAFPDTFVKADLVLCSPHHPGEPGSAGKLLPPFVLFPAFPGLLLEQDRLLLLLQWRAGPWGAAAWDWSSCWCEAGPDRSPGSAGGCWLLLTALPVSTT